MNNIIIYQKNAFKSGIIEIKGDIRNYMFELLLNNKGKVVKKEDLFKNGEYSKNNITFLKKALKGAYDILNYKGVGYILTDISKRKRRRKCKNLKEKY